MLSLFMKAPRLRAISMAALISALVAVVAACGGDTVVERVVETVIVEKAVKGDTIVQTVVVEKEVKGDDVIQTVVVEKKIPVKGDTVVVTATAGAVPIPTVEPEKPAPAPKGAQGTLTFATIQIHAAQGLNSTGGPPKNIFPVTEDLFVYDFDGDRESLQLAESWDLASDLSYVDVTVKTGIPWQGGGNGDFGDLSAHDVAYSYNDANPAFNPVSITDGGGFWSNLIGNQEVIALDDKVVRFPIAQFDVRWASFYLTDSGLGAQVISEKVLAQMGEDWTKANPIGTGPYTVSEWEEGGKVVLERVEKHWRQTGEASSITFIHAPEEATRLAMMRTGEADSMEISVNQIPAMQRNGMVAAGTGGGIQMGVFFSGNLWETVHAGTGEDLPAAGTFVHDIQWIGNPFSPADANNPDSLACSGVAYPEILEVGKGCGDMEQARLVRQALAVAIDRDLIQETVLGGIGNPVYVDYFDPKDSNWQDKWFVPYDVDLANENLDKAGFKRGDNGDRFRMALYAGPELGGGLGISGEIADAVAGFWQELGIGVEVQKGAYAIFRPSVVGRTNTVPWLTSCGEGRDGNPWDWPKGVQMTSRSRGGFSCGFETPFAAEQYGKAAANPDKNERISLMNETANYLFEQSLNPGVVSVPLSVVYNPNSIAEWPMRPDWRSGWNAPEYIKLAR
jgi:ABC-type transport system substrate-binding protein